MFSIEVKLVETREFESRATPGKKTGVLAIVEGVKFWGREDALNEDKNLIDPAVRSMLQQEIAMTRLLTSLQVLRPMSRLGGITYGRLTEAIELPRPDFEDTMKAEEVKKLVKPKASGQ